MEEAAAHLSYQEYLALELERGERCEYADGLVYAMAGGTPTHSRLCSNTLAQLQLALAGRRCVVHGPELKLRVEATNRATYADASVFCDELETSEVDGNAATNPRVIIEVLSPSTEAADRGEKFRHYQHFEALEEYVLVSQDRPRVEVFTRIRAGRGPQDAWRLTIRGPGDEVAFASLDVAVAVDAIYHDPLAG